MGTLLDPIHVLVTLPNGRKTYMEMIRGGATFTLPMEQYYELADCSGEAHVSWSFEDEVVPPALMRPWGVWATLNNTTQERTIRSMRTVGASGPGACQTFSSARSITTTRFEYYSPEQLNLVPPFSVD